LEVLWLPAWIALRLRRSIGVLSGLLFISGLFTFWRLVMSTYFPKAGEIVRKWYVVDASEQTLGRLASQVARVLMGKENPKYTPFLDTGDHVIVINAEKVKTTGMKSEQ
jgi:hypothetical protein